MIKITMHRDFWGVMGFLAFCATVVGVCVLGGCSIVRVAVEQGPGAQHADTAANATATLDAQLDADIDGGNLPIGE